MKKLLLILFTLSCLINTATFAAFPVTEHSSTETLSTPNHLDLIEPNLEVPIYGDSPVFGISSFIFSLLGLVSWALTIVVETELFWFSLLFGIAAVVLGAIGFSRSLKGLAITGFIIGIIETAFCIIVLTAIGMYG